jgi:uncharacterized membrane protein YgaE (UPF0421/DUF939 family)
VAGGTQADALRRFERRIRRRLDARLALRRAWESVPAAVQIVVAATVSYFVAHTLLGHAYPVVAVTVTISALGFTRDARPRRVLESVIGILVGIVLAEVLLLLIGTGALQIALVLFLAIVVARFVSPSNAFAVAASVQAMLVMLIPPPDGGVFLRSIDGLVGGVMALLVTALIPRDPRRAAVRDARRLVSTLTESVGTVVDALRTADEPAAGLALERLRRTQSLVDEWAASLDSALAIARISPFLRRHLSSLRAQVRVVGGLDLSARHLRLITRRIDFLVRDGRQRPELAALLERIATGITLLGEAVDGSAGFDPAREHLVELALDLDPATALPGAAVTDSIVVHLLRPLVVDLLVASGLSIEDARGTLPPV